MTMDNDDNVAPESVEEAGALLGAAILQCSSSSNVKMVAPPKGMHSSFATIAPAPMSDLYSRLHALRAQLKSVPFEKPLVASPSILAVLMKLLGVSSSMATSPTTNHMTPSMWSTPLRTLWVESVVLCLVLGEGLTGKTRNDVVAFMRSMMALASMNPKSAKAAGGARIAALQVLGGLFSSPQLSTKLAPWALDVLQLCHRGLKSSGNGEPTHRIASVQTACSVIVACRQAATARTQSAQRFVIRGALEDRAIIETVRLLRLACTDKFPEVRSAAATLAGIVAPLMISQNSTREKPEGSIPPTAGLEDVLTLSLRNIDDESAGVAAGWSEALGRCLCTSVEYGELMRANASERSAAVRNSSDDGASSDSSSLRFASRKAIGVAMTCSSLNAAVQFLVDHFAKVGGELAASRCGGSFSMGGRAVRIGVSLALVKLLSLQCQAGNIGSGRSMTMAEAIKGVLGMVGPEVQKQLRRPESGAGTMENLDATSTEFDPVVKSSSTSLFSSSRYRSHADAGLARLATSRALRQGLSEMASEPTQVSILHDLIRMCSIGGESLRPDAEGEAPASSAQATPLNPHQLQVVLIEISHLIMTLGEAAAASLVDLVPALKECLAHAEHGVRHEAAIACAAVSTAFPNKGRKLFRLAVDDIQLHHADLVTLACMGPEAEDTPARKRRFRRSPEKSIDKSLPHQYAIHGHALMISILLQELPHLPGGLSTDMLSTGLSVAEILVSCQYSDVMTKGNAGAACTCVRAGYGIISGVLSTGATAITPHIALIFGLWQKSGKSAADGSKNFSTDHDLICLDAALSSIVVFLKHCSELLMAVPDALSKTSLILEEALPLFFPNGRLGRTPLNPAAASRLSSAKASIMEAYSWLPPGSFPLVADKLFTFAARHIQTGTEEEVTCSILTTLVNNEDKLLDAKTLCRAQRPGQVGGARNVQDNLVVLTSEAAHHGERESVLHFGPNNTISKNKTFQDSYILGLFASEENRRPPTPLHAVGTWREPITPSCCSKVRLFDAAVQAFAATFSMKDGKEQQRAMDMLESLVPPFLAQLARAIGVNTALTEPERRSKTKEESAAVANITAVLLACLQALPVYEATHNVPIGLGPRWMNKAKDLLLTLLPSASNIVRRAAAEGLALLATLGVSEDAHTLQSAVLHSLDEVMQGNQPDGKPRPIPLEPVSAARAGSLLTLACIQRTAHNIKVKQNARKRGQPTSPGQVETLDDTLPTIQMMTRLLPSIACNIQLRDAFVVKTYALHSFGLLISYSTRLDAPSLSAEVEHLLRKAVEAVETNFLASWTAASADYDQGQESEKLGSEAAFLSVLLRLMTFLLPALDRLKDSDSSVALRFSRMATSIAESCSSHPNILMEAMAFFERLSAFQHLLPTPSPKVNHTENAPFTCVPVLLYSIIPDRPMIQGELGWTRSRGCHNSPLATRAAVLCVKLLAEAHVILTENQDAEVPSLLLSLLEVTCGTRCFSGAALYRPIAAPREAELASIEHDAIETDIVAALDSILILESFASATAGSKRLLHWILVARSLLVGSVESADGDDGGFDDDPFTRANVIRNADLGARNDAALVLNYASPSRWQVKCQAARSGCVALQQINMMIHANACSTHDSPDFNLSLANEACLRNCRELKRANSSEVPSSYVVFHLADILAAACSSAVATLDHSELHLLQEGGLRLLSSMVAATGDIPDPEQPDVTILEQYTSQIFSSVKHGLGSSEETDGEGSFRLFMVGCEALQTVMENGLVTDPMVMKRLSRPVIPSASEIPFCAYDIESSESPLRPSEQDDPDVSKFLPRIGKLWTVAKLRFFADRGILSENVAAPLLEELGKCKGEVAIHSAALAIDGARLLRGYGMTLCGAPAEPALDTGADVDKDDDSDPSISFTSGLTYMNIINLDDRTKAGMVHAWPACACNAVTYLVDILTTEGTDSTVIEACLVWLEKIVPIVFAGLHDALLALTVDIPEETAHSWSKGLFPKEIAVMCLHGIRVLVRNASQGLFDVPGKEELGSIVHELAKHILFPLLSLDKASSSPLSATKNEGSSTEHMDEKLISDEHSRELVSETCELLEELAASRLMAQTEESELLRTVLVPLGALQKGRVAFDNDLAAKIIASCLQAARQLVDKPNVENNLVKAMLHLSLEILSTSEPIPETVTKAASLLLVDCMDHESMTASEQRLIAKDLAKKGNWDAWAVVCAKLEDGSGMRYSLGGVREAMEDLRNAQRHLAVLSAIRRVVQSAPFDSQLVGCVMNGVGAQALVLLQAYGALSYISTKDVQAHRTIACADAMKIVMVAFQHLTSDEVRDEQQISAFLSLVFEVLVSLILFNGLPNHPSRTPSGADPALGRMAAQATMHVVRTTPVQFKTCMASMSDQGRAVLEMAVRAEMSGYAAPQVQAPAKKKLSLKGFKK